VRELYPVDVVVSLLKEEGVRLEYVRAAVTADQLARGVDLLRTPDNEITLIAGRTCEDQVWQSVRVSSGDPSVHVALSVGDRIVGGFCVDSVAGHVTRQRLAELRVVPRGSVVRAVARSASAPPSTRIVLEVFGWGVTDAMLPAVEEAVRLMSAS